MLFRSSAQALLLDGFQSAGGDAQLDKAVAFGPPQTAFLQIHLLELLGAHVGVRDGHAVVGALAGELADPRHDRFPKRLAGQQPKFTP